MALLKYENLKLKQQLIFSIPVSKEICGRECAGCYALKPQKRFPKVLESRYKTYNLTLDDRFVDMMNAELADYDEFILPKKRNPNRVVRIHEAGEFYSKSYIKKWKKIAKANPSWTFYSFTKRLNDFPEAFKKFMKLDNVFITDSLYNNEVNYGNIEPHPDELTPNRPLDLEDTVNGMKICPATIDKDFKCKPEACNWCYRSDGSVENGVFFKKH